MFVKYNIITNNMDEINKLLNTRLLDLDGRQYLALQAYANNFNSRPVAVERAQAIGIAQLAQALHCSVSQVAKMRREGILDDAVISRLGRNIIFDIRKAENAANKWHENKHNI